MDILVVDTPPGTGDVHLSLSQNVPLSGVVLVSTPQTSALNVTKRGADMVRSLQLLLVIHLFIGRFSLQYKTLNVPIIGIVENMSYINCEKCGAQNMLFKNAIDEFSREMNIDVLGKIPLEKEIIRCCESGTPSCIRHPDSSFTVSYRQISRKIIEYLDELEMLQAKSKSS